MYVRTDIKSGAACYTVQSGDSYRLKSQRDLSRPEAVHP
jgi:hypothetical protein